MSGKIKIGVDIDGVLANSGETIIQTVNERYGHNITADMIKDYWYENPELAHAKDHIRSTWDTSHEGELLANSPLMPHAKLFNMLPGTVELITHRRERNKVATHKWLDNNGFYNYERLVFADGPKSKLGPWDYFIEDCVDNVFDLEEHVNRKILLVNHPYNISLNVPNNVIRVDDWLDITSFFKNEIIRGNF